MIRLPFYEKLQLSDLLNSKSELFQYLFDRTEIYLDDIAEVTVVTDNGIRINIPVSLWRQSDDVSKSYLLCHALTHVLLCHDSRSERLPDKSIAHAAADIAVNEFLEQNYGFEKLNVKLDSVWFSDVFDDTVERFQKFESYYSLLETAKLKSPNVDGGDGQAAKVGKSFDKFSEKGGSSHIRDSVSKFIKNAPDEAERELPAFFGHLPLTDEEVEARIEKAKIRVAPNRSWVSFFRSALPTRRHDHELFSWAKRPKRLGVLDKSIIVPDSLEYEEPRYNLWLFVDVSGSCEDLWRPFTKLAATIPQEKYDIRLFSFADYAVENDKSNGKFYEQNIKMVRCTQPYENYDAVSRKISKVMGEERCGFPDLVAVFTDGEGTVKTSVEFSNRWHWFLAHPKDHNPMIVESSAVPLAQNGSIHRLNEFDGFKDTCLDY